MTTSIDKNSEPQSKNAATRGSNTGPSKDENGAIHLDPFGVRTCGTVACEEPAASAPECVMAAFRNSFFRSQHSASAHVRSICNWFSQRRQGAKCVGRALPRGRAMTIAPVVQPDSRIEDAGVVFSVSDCDLLWEDSASASGSFVDCVSELPVRI
jgi:hypothetical protein